MIISLTYVLKSAKLDTTGHRLLAQLANYQFTISYLPGLQNKAADALPRMHWPKVNSEVISHLLNAHPGTILLSVIAIHSNQYQMIPSCRT